MAGARDAAADLASAVAEASAAIAPATDALLQYRCAAARARVSSTARRWRASLLGTQRTLRRAPLPTLLAAAAAARRCRHCAARSPPRPTRCVTLPSRVWQITRRSSPRCAARRTRLRYVGIRLPEAAARARRASAPLAALSLPSPPSTAHARLPPTSFRPLTAWRRAAAGVAGRARVARARPGGCAARDGQLLRAALPRQGECQGRLEKGPRGAARRVQ